MSKIRHRWMGIALSLTLAAAGCASDAPLTKGDDLAADQAASTRVTDLSAESRDETVELTITADGPIQYTVFKMTDPRRLIVDMSQVDISGHQDSLSVDHALVREVRPIYFAKSNDSRIEVDLNEDVDYQLSNDDPARLTVTIARKGADLAAAETSPAAMSEQMVEPEPMDTMTVTALATEFARVENVDFRQLNGLSRIEVTMSKPGTAYQLLARDNLNRLTLDLPGAVVAPEEERLINVNLDQSKVKNVAVFQFSGGENPIAKVVVNLEKMQLYNVSADGNKIVLDIGDEAVLALATQVSEEKEKKLVKKAAPEVSPGKKYTGSRVSLDFQKADIHNILRIIADVSGMNVITSDKVKGEVTIKLRNVPWDQALEVVLRNNGLDMIMEGNIIRVSTAQEIQREKDARKQLLETEAEIAPLFHKIIEVNYENAASMKANLESLKSKRGTIEINARTNVLILKDTKEKLAQMGHLIRALDKREQQVVIEARIVETTQSLAKALGIQWGGFYNDVTGRNFPSTIGVTGGAGPGVNTPVGGSVVNLPVPATGAIGITLGHISGTALLDARLMAMQEDGQARIVSMPKITTMNNKEALIESGAEIPYQTVSAEGTQTEFKKATLSLKVTPHVTPDRFIRLEIETHKDEPGPTPPGGVPPILTKQAKTEVLVADGDTTVIGGLFKNSSRQTDAKVPFFGDVPFLGWLFKSRDKRQEGEELLIFITPKIAE